jgi:hypothetical protein
MWRGSSSRATEPGKALTYPVPIASPEPPACFGEIAYRTPTNARAVSAPSNGIVGGLPAETFKAMNDLAARRPDPVT